MTPDFTYYSSVLNWSHTATIRVSQNKHIFENLCFYKFFPLVLVRYPGKYQKSWKKLLFKGGKEPLLVYYIALLCRNDGLESFLKISLQMCFKGHQNVTWASGHEKVHLEHFIAKFLLNPTENQGSENGHLRVFWTSG